MGCAGSRAVEPPAAAGRPPQPQAQAPLDEILHADAKADRREQSTAEKGTDVAAQLQTDAVRLESARQQPLPEKSKWKLCGGDELEPLLAHTDVIDAKWLLKLLNREVMPEREGVVPAWQDVPPEAKLSLATLRRTTLELKLPVAVLSYGWAAKRHPDPTGALLRRLKPVLERMAHCCEHGRAPQFPDQRPAAWGIVWDFMSLPQRGYTTGYVPDECGDDGKIVKSNDDRTPYQLARFGSGLKGINVWYGSVHTTTLVCDWPMPANAENASPIATRGWCIFEKALSSVRKDGRCCLALGQLADGATGHWLSLEVACRAGRAPPLAPDAFEAMLREGVAREAAVPGTGFRFTNGKDATAICIPQYREGFLRLLRGGGMLAFDRCGWGDAEVRVLAAALAYAHANGATTQADSLFLSANRLSDAALPPLVEAIAAGATPELENLRLEGNELGDAALATLRPLLAGPLSGLVDFAIGKRLTAEGVRSLVALLADGHLAGLENIDLSGNGGLGDQGAAAIAGALSEGWLPELEKLRLDGTGMGDEGATALAGALGGAPKLTKLVVGKNAFGEDAKTALKAACAKRGVAAMAGYFDAL